MQALHVKARAAIVFWRNCRRAQFIGLAHAHASLDATASHPHREAVGVVIPARTLSIFGRGLPAKLAPPNHQRAVQQTRSLQVGEQGRHRLIGVARVEVMIFFQIAVRIPVVVVVGAARVELDKPYPSFHQSPRQEATPTEIRRPRIVQTVELLGGRSFQREIHGLRRVLLHLPRQFVGGNPGSQFGVVTAGQQVRCVGLSQRVEHHALRLGRHIIRRGKIQNRLAFTPQQRALIRCRHESAGPVFGSRNRAPCGIQHHHKPRQILVHTAQTVVGPRAQAGRAALNLA